MELFRLELACHSNIIGSFQLVLYTGPSIGFRRLSRYPHFSPTHIVWRPFLNTMCMGRQQSIPLEKGQKDNFLSFFNVLLIVGEATPAADLITAPPPSC